MNTEVKVILGPSIVNGDIYRFISTRDESGIIEIWDPNEKYWLKVWYYENDITPELIAKGEALDQAELELLSTLRKKDQELELYKAKNQIDSACWQALSCFVEASELDSSYKIDSIHSSNEAFLILFRGTPSLHKTIFEFLLNALDLNCDQKKFDEFYRKPHYENDERVDFVLQGPLLIEKKKKIIRVVEERPNHIKRLDIFESCSFRPVRDGDSVSWYDLRDAKEISLTEFYNIVRPPIGVVHTGSNIKSKCDTCVALDR